MQKIFITSSGTNVGKTLFTCALIQAIKTENKNVHAIKPIISGFKESKKPNDISLIADSLQLEYNKKNISKINHLTFSRPLSPDMAARIEKKPEINYVNLVKFCKKAEDKKLDYLIIEGAGGVMVPINKTKTMLNLTQDVANKNILVVGSYLGSLSHTLTAYKTLENNKMKPNLIVVTQNLFKSEDLYIPVIETIKSLEKFVTCPIIAIEKIAGEESEKIKKLAKILTNAKILKII
jgi:dethiobiotin synthetase